MKRSKPLRAAPETVRRWEQRSRERALARAHGREGMLSMLLRAELRDVRGQRLPDVEAIAAGRRRKKAKIKVGVRNRVLARSEGLCIVCVFDLRVAGKRPGSAMRATQVHHVLQEHKWPQYATVEDHLVGVCVRCHERHEQAVRRIPRDALPACAIRFAEGEGLSWYIEETYPLVLAVGPNARPTLLSEVRALVERFPGTQGLEVRVGGRSVYLGPNTRYDGSLACWAALSEFGTVLPLIPSASERMGPLAGRHPHQAREEDQHG